ncbi:MULTISPECIES: hypothetical protein [unclassified Xanthobacter]|nr:MULTISPECIES: hypothetical protein [unclassified Xanthobacter]
MEPNCEKHPLHRGTYIVYDAAGFAFRAYKVGKTWWAKPSHLRASVDRRMRCDDTLRGLCREIGRSYWVPPAVNAK